MECLDCSASKPVSQPVLCACGSRTFQAGALDGFSVSRSRVVLEAQLWNVLTEKEKVLAMQYGPECGNDLLKTVKKLFDLENPTHSPVFTEFRTVAKRNS